MAMKVVMLGQSAAGKTTYVSLMYALMMHGGAGFTIRAKHPLDHERLIRTAEAVLTGAYPSPSDQRSVFEFVLQHEGSDVFEFQWRDYRGGTLTERTDSPQAAEMHRDLRDADGIMILCDSVKLLTSPAVGREVRTLVNHVQRAISERHDVATPLVIAATKADLVDIEDEKVCDRLAEPFLPLIEAVASSRHVIGTFVPVACGPEQFNVHIPVLWMLRFGIIGRAQQLERTIQSHIDQMQRHQNNDTLGDRFGAWWNGYTPQWQLAERSRNSAAAELARYEPLIAPADQLGEILQDVPGF
ncbi:hypothetical protein Cs7R123_44780 [Catellatospora sp. TT07R-123]|uniref:TRAFAC clade GTPase domain-containing protein n=1 Tax=Catellatospora sp. TT07R-123 TaxID=2733863 RepID=UPI001B2BF796|nr:GTPase domain-containing protein [Catellatospora sp. TT07R-123]GHJ47136.1 hypothetical protein Cs7R123_44780 [Catellatospora sp. TT07R-123]